MLLLLLCLWMQPAVSQALFYRYKDDNGILVLATSIPPEYARKGYQVVDQYGRIVREVAPALTSEQLAEIERKKQEEARQAELARQQAEADALLLRLYSQPEDAERARDRKLQELDGLVKLKEQSIQRLRTKIIQQESEAADIERAGRKIPRNLLTEIERGHARVKALRDEIKSHQATRIQIVEEFAPQIERLRVLNARHQPADKTSEHP